MYELTQLDEETAQTHVAILTGLADQIPLVEYTEEEILAEGKPDGSRPYFGKWERSLILFDGDKPIGFVMGYGRRGEGNEQYPNDTIYISELGVDPDYQGQGLGRQLVEAFLDRSREIGMGELEGDVNFSIQTNSDEELNGHVIRLYKSLGFVPRATKTYENRVDLVMGLEEVVGV